MKTTIEPEEALTGVLTLEGVGKIGLDLLVTFESGTHYIRCLNFGIMSSGETIEECKENIREAIEIYLNDLSEGESLFKACGRRYWEMFYRKRSGLQSEWNFRAQLQARGMQASQNQVSRSLRGLCRLAGLS